MKTHRILIALIGSALVAGCSGGKQASRATPTPSLDNHKMMLEIAQCARAHGAPNFPDPIVDPKGDWDFPNSVQRQPKVPACDALVIRWKRANPQRARQTVSPQDLVKLRDYAACMRQQGLSDWPDPAQDGSFKLPARLSDPKRFQKQDKVCFSKAPRGGIKVVGGPGKGR